MFSDGERQQSKIADDKRNCKNTCAKTFLYHNHHPPFQTHDANQIQKPRHTAEQPSS
jgi:hypothetical protein